MTDYAASIRAADQKMRRTLITPEGVDLSLRLATAGHRIGAFALDLVFLLVALIVLTVIAVTGFFAASQLGAVIWMLGFTLLRNLYFVLLEMGPRAATFGKRIVGIRVVARNGGRLTADAVIARNLLREIEFYLPLSFLGYRATEGSANAAMAWAGLAWACIFLFFPLFNKDRLRVGDLLAGTWVIAVPKRKLGFDLMKERAAPFDYDFTDEQLDAYGIFELQTLERVLRERNIEAMTVVAHSIRNKLGLGEVRSTPEFLTAYYEALRARLERKLLFGKRRLDKHDGA